MQGLVREARLEDAEAIAELLTQLGYPSSEPQARRRLQILAAQPKTRVFVLEANGEVAGLSMTCITQPIEHDDPWCQLAALVVAEAHRRTGAGRLLLNAVEAEARAHGSGGIVLGSATHRRDAHSFYERMGFKQTGWRFMKALR
jgi:ribosomal protein S18 acetylase RimI-like enzyme